MCSRRAVPLLAVGLTVLGLALVLLGPADHAVYSAEYEGGAQDSSTLSMTYGGAFVLSYRSLAGYGLLWLGTILMAGFVGHRVARRSTTAA